MLVSATTLDTRRHRGVPAAWIAWVVTGSLAVLGGWGSAHASADGASAPADPAEARWNDARIQEAIQAGCDRSHPLHRFRGQPARFHVVGPIWLSELKDERERGVVLPTYLRLFHYGAYRRCAGVDLEEARALAGPETWVVLWRVEVPFRGRGRRTDSDQKVLRPTAVKLRYDGKWHQPLESRTEDRWMRYFFDADWNEEESLVAVFDRLPSSALLQVDYELEESGRAYLRPSSQLSVSDVTKKWWALAHGEPEPEGGSWWRR
jgi:hypothetical protein